MSKKEAPDEPVLFIENIKNPTVRFRIISYDAETHIGILAGKYGAEFSRNLSKDSLTNYGYRVVRGKESDGGYVAAAPNKKRT